MIRDMLESYGQECLNLAQKLSEEGGRDFKEHEIRIIKVAMLPAINEEYEIAIARYLIGGEMEPDFSFTEFSFTEFSFTEFSFTEF